MKRRILSFTAFITIVLVAGSVLWVHAGSLTPPAGPVAPTMKTLAEISDQITGGPIKRVLRGTLFFDKNAPDSSVASSSEPFSPAIDPARSIVLLSDAVMTETVASSTNAYNGRTGASVESLTSTQITVRIDATKISSKVSYQIVEYN